MIAEFGIIPDVFEKASYSSLELGEERLANLAELCLEEALVRDFCAGRWSARLREESDNWHPATKEIIEALCKEKRLKEYDQVLPSSPEDTQEWYYEAIGSHERAAMDMILTGNAEACGSTEDDRVTPMSALRSSKWYRKRSSSFIVRRHPDDYLALLRPVLRQAKLLMFIDPHIDERATRGNYAHFHRFFLEIGRRTAEPKIEIHIWQAREEGQAVYENRLARTNDALRRARLKADVFAWPKNFHNRYLLTDLIGIKLGNGFDIPTSPLQQSEDDWDRMSRTAREHRELSFEPNRAEHGVPRQFEIGCT